MLRHTLTVGGILGVGVIATILIPPEAPILASDSSNSREVSEYWEARIRHSSPERAHKEFIDDYPKGSTTGHTAAHLFGEALYGSVGIRGITTCTDEHSYGCYHEFIAQVLAAHGPGVIPEIESSCASIDSPESCSHGMGHGLLKYYGYEDGIVPALKICNELIKTYKHSCASAVFMEYETPFSLDADGTKIEGPTPGPDPFILCESPFPDIFKKDCYFSIPNWMYQHTRSLDTAVLSCDKAPAEFQSYCYAGVGTSLPGSVSYDQTAIIHFCRALPTLGQTGCLSQSKKILDSFKRDSSLVAAEL